MFKKVNVLEPFLAEPGREFHLRGLANVLEVSPATVKSKIEPLVKGGLLSKRRERNALVFSPNLESEPFKRRLAERNVEALRSSGLVSFLEKEFLVPCIILFGSWAKGENRDRSDIDLFVQSEVEKELELSKFEERLGASIELFVHSKESVDRMKKRNPELLNNIINGRILSGFFEVF